MKKWYHFTTQPGADPSEPNNYSNPQDLRPSCPGSPKLCAILACDDGFGFPVITTQLLTDIANAINTETESGTVTLRF